jgi:4-carboxymuconolactone decarboxylase
MTRYPLIPPEDMYFEQRRVAQAVAQRRKGGLAGPFIPLVHVPGILDRFQTLGEHVRFDTGLPRKLIELVILITARHVQAPFEFHVHSPPAREFGVSDETIEALAANRRPAKLDDDEAVVYDFCTELHKTGRVSDEMFARTDKRFGKAVILDLIATCGYYGALGWVLNVTHTFPPPDVVPPFPVAAD